MTARSLRTTLCNVIRNAMRKVLRNAMRNVLPTTCVTSWARIRSPTMITPLPFPLLAGSKRQNNTAALSLVDEGSEPKDLVSPPPADPAYSGPQKMLQGGDSWALSSSRKATPTPAQPTPAADAASPSPPAAAAANTSAVSTGLAAAGATPPSASTSLDVTAGKADGVKDGVKSEMKLEAAVQLLVALNSSVGPSALAAALPGFHVSQVSCTAGPPSRPHLITQPS